MGEPLRGQSLSGPSTVSDGTIVARFTAVTRAFAAYPPSLRSVRYSTVPDHRRSRSHSVPLAGNGQKRS